jgi:hypothetical protein
VKALQVGREDLAGVQDGKEDGDGPAGWQDGDGPKNMNNSLASRKASRKASKALSGNGQRCTPCDAGKLPRHFLEMDLESFQGTFWKWTTMHPLDQESFQGTFWKWTRKASKALSGNGQERESFQGTF